ncbi:MAG TPA: MMPL family transporter [Candidatus Binataceae bacterium]|nr:MMPL family transporter [Candidatus Binataceae bacterium]
MISPSPQPLANLRYRVFAALARLDVRRPWLVIALSLALAAGCVLYTWARLEFRTGQDDLISANNRDSRNYLRFTAEFPDLDGLIVVVKVAPDAARAERFADTLAGRLIADKVNVKSVFYRIDARLMGNSALLMLSDKDLEQLNARLTASLPMLEAYGANPTLAALFGIVNAQLDRATSSITGAEAGGAAENSGMDLMLIDAILGAMIAEPEASAQAKAEPAPSARKASSPWAALDPLGRQAGVMGDGYLASDNGKYLLLNIAARDGAKDGPDPVDVIQSQVDAVRAQFPGIDAGMTGGPALARAEESTTQHDMMLGSILAVTGLILLLVVPFRGVVEPLFAIVALLTGVAWSFGFTTVAVGHLNLLSAVFTSVLAGIGINFPIHLMARYDEARRQGLAMPEAVELAVVNTGTGVFASACIMALAFLMPMFTDFKGIAELGLVSAAGLFLCLISALLIFPAMVALRDRGRPAGVRPVVSLTPQRSLLEKLFARPGVIVGVTTIATLGALFLIRGVRFDQNVLKLQASDAEAVRFENTLLYDSGRSSWFAVALAATSAEADRKAAAFHKLPEVTDIETISTYIPEHQAEKRALLGALGQKLAALKISAGAHSDGAALKRELSGLAGRLEAMSQFDTSGSVLKTAGLAEDAIARLKEHANAFAAYERRIATSLATALAELKPQLSPGEVTEKTLPAILRQRFIGTGGHYLVQIYPKGDIWEDAPLQRFVGALRTVDRDVTGPPVQTYNLASVMRQGYERAALLALIAVFIFVFADFRNFRDTLLATVPLVFGGAWLLEAMPLLGWKFNLANLFAVPIIIGMGVDNGVNMLYRWREERDKSSLILTKAVGKSVTICSLTTIAAFAALIPASHRGISSLGWVLSAGVTLILVATLIVLPALFELLGSRIKPEPPAMKVGLGATLVPEVVEPLVVEPPGSAAAPSRSTGTHDL